MTSANQVTDPANKPANDTSIPDRQVAASSSPKPPRSARSLFCLVLLILEALVALFFALVLSGLRVTDGTTATLIGGLVAATALLSAVLVYSAVGMVLGTLVQVALLASGVYVIDMLILGVIFAGLWGGSVFLGSKIDRERKIRYDDELAEFAAGKSLD